MESRVLRWFVLFSVIAMFGGAAHIQAAPNSQTVINTKKLCPFCAKKIEAKIRAMKGVADVQADPSTKSFTVLPIAGSSLSPRTLWETIEKGGEQPIRLHGPYGTFVTKPKF